jgi:hypothetical protein
VVHGVLFQFNPKFNLVILIAGIISDYQPISRLFNIALFNYLTKRCPMKKFQLHFTFYLLRKFKKLMMAGISVPMSFSDKLWKYLISKNLFKLKPPEAASGCCEKLE